MNTDYAHKVISAIEACQIDEDLSILSADTDKVKSYVYSSTKLPEMRGASVILDELNQDKIKDILVKNYCLKEECLLFNKGGSVLAIVPTSMVYKIKSDIERLYPHNTHGLASITAVTEQIELPQLNSDFKAIVKRLSNKLKQAKEEKKAFPVYEVIPYARRCGSCGIRPANVIDNDSPDKPYLCKSCKMKREKGKGEKSEFLKKFMDFLEKVPENHKSLDSIINKCKEQKINYNNLKSPKDLEDIEDENGYIGVIYADGNEIGAIIEELDSPGDFVEFSDKLYNITEKSVFSAIAEYINPSEAGILPFEIISIGGDDVFIILPANIALQVTNQLCKNLKDKTENSGMPQMKDITFSVGVTIAKSNFPIYYIYDLVNQLLKNAKKTAKKDPNNMKTAIDFMVFKSQGGEISNINDYREQILTDHKERGSLNQEFTLTFRPYFMDEFDKLINLVKKMNEEKFSKSKLYAIRESIEHGKENSMLQYLYMMVKSPEKERKLLQYVLPSTLLEDNRCSVPWIKGKDVPSKYVEYKTPIVDILEIYDFIREEP
jgi:CRISPR/Cas system-associated protein Cas10 (large subunit of type III CRISPR-Cas system)